MRRVLALAVVLAAPACVAAQERAATPAAGIDVFVSSDADDTEVRRLGLTADWRFVDARRYAGLELERARISPIGGPAREYDRAFYRFAGTATTGEWNGRVGTDGHRLLGAVSLVHTGPFRTELFAERDVLETRGGLARGQVATFAGAAVDLPLGDADRRQLTLLGGVQDFDDGNLRTHLRATLVQTLSERYGLSAQLRMRAFRNSDPGAGDYFSPEAFVEAVPVLQVRRRLAGGWIATAAAGWGRQRHTGTDWRTARLVQASITRAVGAGRSHLRATFNYSDTPGVGGDGYGYRQATLQWVRPF